MPNLRLHNIQATPGDVMVSGLTAGPKARNRTSSVDPGLVAPWRSFRCALLVSALLFAGLLDVASGQTTKRVSVASSGVEGNDGSSHPSISADGRCVAFTSEASNLVLGDGNSERDVFVHDHTSGHTEIVSVSNTGAEGNERSTDSTISADGRYVAFGSWAFNLVPGDTNFWEDVFVRDRATGRTVRVSVSTAGGEGNGGAREPSISADGRYVAFSSAASNLVPDDTNSSEDVFLHDRATGRTERVSVSSTGVEGDDNSRRPVISAHGRYVAFDSFSSNLVSDDLNGFRDVFVHDRATGQTVRVSESSSGLDGSSHSSGPRISADGRYVAFSSSATNLVPGDLNGRSDAFVHDRATTSTVRVSVSSSGAEGDGGSDAAGISADGRYVALSSLATNLVPDDDELDCVAGLPESPVECRDIFVHDRALAQTERVSLSASGLAGNDHSSEGAISADGRAVAFRSYATNLVSADTNDIYDVFVRLRPDLPPHESAPSVNFSWSPAFPNRGQPIVFSDASDGYPSIYKWDLDGDGTPDSLAANPTFALDPPGTHWVTLTACNAAGCDTHGESIVVADAGITISGPTSGAVSDILMYTATASGCTPDPTGWVWETDLGNDPGSGSTASILWTHEGEKLLSVRNTGCGRLVGSLQVSITGLGFPDLPGPGSNLIFCGLTECSTEIDPDRPTVVLIHGMQWSPLNPFDDYEPGDEDDLWSGFASYWDAGSIVKFSLLGGEANVIQYLWPDAWNPYTSSRFLAIDAGYSLARILLDQLGAVYSQPIQFVAHSLGNVVGAVAAREFLTRATGVTEAQFTSLERPYYLLGLGWVLTEAEEARFRIGPEYLARVLPFNRDGLDLRVDNYFGDGVTATGDLACGTRVYNHGVLEDARLVGDYVLDEFGSILNHTGVQQWYRWTMQPLYEWRTVCPGGVFEDPTAGPWDPDGDLQDSLDPCDVGWVRGLAAQGTFDEFPTDYAPSCGVVLPFSLPLGSASTDRCGSGIGGEFTCTASSLRHRGELLGGESTPVFSTVTLTLPEGASYLTFDFRFEDAHGGDAYAAVLLGDAPIWTLRGSVSQPGVVQTAAPIPVEGWGDAPSLTVALFPEGDAEVSVEFREFRFLMKSPLAPAGLKVDTVEVESNANRVLEPGERVEVGPAWANHGESLASLQGTAVGFDGPGGASYSLPDPDAAYGDVEPGEVVSCQSPDGCYEVEVTPGTGGRPAVHWDATLEESLSDDAATSHDWVLHLGDSFADVPRTSLFYRFIETLLHHGVTSGCSATSYCPTASNTRSQMAVFLLKAAEGADYVPPPCTQGSPPFGDVSVDSQFCPWIQDLVARGVTSGCGGGNYCPNASVTRGQMAVFLLKAFEGAGYTPPACTEQFADVPCSSPFAPWIEELADRGITGGCSATEYCPTAAVTRAQMAVFLTKTFGLAIYGP